jgi:hypothetical protein
VQGSCGCGTGGEVLGKKGRRVAGLLRRWTPEDLEGSERDLARIGLGTIEVAVSSISSNVEARGSSFGRGHAKCKSGQLNIEAQCIDRMPRTSKRLILGYSGCECLNTQYLAPIQTSKRYLND